MDQLVAVMEKLAVFPEMGRPRYEIRPKLRSFVSPPYIIFYRRQRDGVHIHRILHERRDIDKAFPKRRQR
jgi:toxin ParE1/3/4